MLWRHDARQPLSRIIIYLFVFRLLVLFEKSYDLLQSPGSVVYKKLSYNDIMEYFRYVERSLCSLLDAALIGSAGSVFVIQTHPLFINHHEIACLLLGSAL